MWIVEIRASSLVRRGFAVPRVVHGAHSLVGTGDGGASGLHSRGGVVPRNPQVIHASRHRRPHSCSPCLIRLMSSCTWSNTDRCSEINVVIFSTACITVVWSRPPNSRPIWG